MGKAKPEVAGSGPAPLSTWILAAAVVLFAVVIRVRLLGMPLERDEGEFAYIGQLMLKGIPPYKLAYSMKLPGIYAIYAGIIAVFGRTIIGIHIGLLLANLTTAVLVFCLGRRLWSTQVGLISAASFSILSLGGPVMGTAAHATQFLTPAVLGGILLVLRALEQDRPGMLFWSGMLFGVGFIIKQHALVFAVFAACYLLWRCIRSRSHGASGVPARMGLLVAGVVLPFAVTCLVMLKAGVFSSFWFWVFTYARRYTAEAPLSDGMQLLSSIGGRIAVSTAVLLALSAAGLFALLWDKKLRQHAPFLLGLLVFSFLAVCPGLYFREHYWIQMMPAISLLIGLAVASPSGLRSRWSGSGWLQVATLVIFAAAVAQSATYNKSLYFASNPEEAVHVVYPVSPFAESIELARYLADHTKPSDRIAVLGSEPQIYFYADRLSATAHIYTYGLMEEQPFARRMQEELIRQIEATEPKYIVYVNMAISWLPKPKSEDLLAGWAPGYTDAFYRVVGVADIVPLHQTEYIWGEDAESYTPQSEFCIFVFERKPGL